MHLLYGHKEMGGEKGKNIVAKPWAKSQSDISSMIQELQSARISNIVDDFKLPPKENFWDSHYVNPIEKPKRTFQPSDLVTKATEADMQGGIDYKNISGQGLNYRLPGGEWTKMGEKASKLAGLAPAAVGAGLAALGIKKVVDVLSDMGSAPAGPGRTIESGAIGGGQNDMGAIASSFSLQALAFQGMKATPSAKGEGQSY